MKPLIAVCLVVVSFLAGSSQCRSMTGDGFPVIPVSLSYTNPQDDDEAATNKLVLESLKTEFAKHKKIVADPNQQVVHRLISIKAIGNIAIKNLPGTMKEYTEIKKEIAEFLLTLLDNAKTSSYQPTAYAAADALYIARNSSVIFTTDQLENGTITNGQMEFKSPKKIIVNDPVLIIRILQTYADYAATIAKDVDDSNKSKFKQIIKILAVAAAPTNNKYPTFVQNYCAGRLAELSKNNQLVENESRSLLIDKMFEFVDSTNVFRQIQGTDALSTIADDTSTSIEIQKKVLTSAQVRLKTVTASQAARRVSATVVGNLLKNLTPKENETNTPDSTIAIEKIVNVIVSRLNDQDKHVRTTLVSFLYEFAGPGKGTAKRLSLELRQELFKAISASLTNANTDVASVLSQILNELALPTDNTPPPTGDGTGDSSVPTPTGAGATTTNPSSPQNPTTGPSFFASELTTASQRYQMPRPRFATAMTTTDDRVTGGFALKQTTRRESFGDLDASNFRTFRDITLAEIDFGPPAQTGASGASSALGATNLLPPND